MELRKPQKKGYKLPRFNSPLPICEDNISVSEYDWPLFTGKFNGTSVIVDEISEIIMLVNKGFFGKGSLSRGAPSACKRKPPVNIINESQWKRRKEWSEILISSLNGNITESTVQQNAEILSNKNNEESCTSVASIGDNSNHKNIGNETIDLTDSPANPNILDTDFTNIEQGLVVKVGDRTSKEDVPMETEVPIKGVDKYQHTSKEAPAEMSTNDNLNVLDKKPVDNIVDEDPKLSEIAPVKEATDKESSILEKIPGQSAPMHISEDITITAESKNKEEESALQKSCTGSISDSVVHKEGSEKIKKPPLPIDKDSGLCDDEVLVISDVDNNFEGSLKELNPHIEKEKIKTVIEVLYLSLEEAFFLSFALQCLQIVDLTSNCLTITEIWNLFRASQPDFVEKYVAYHHFRSKGWVVKSGLKYGGDFLLYKKGPLYFHATYVIVVKLLNPDGSKANEHDGLTWDKMLTLNRLCETASKDVLICEVMKPDLPEKMYESPNILKEFKVGELLLRRWQPTQEKTLEVKPEF